MKMDVDDTGSSAHCDNDTVGYVMCGKYATSDALAGLYKKRMKSSLTGLENGANYKIFLDTKGQLI
ncbi:MAG: hypothetical protein CSYNP_00009 [Syntrophus sp. SKADARSKE-3]|nr:hypothetical protein [Syntrophus sp. SKADARSKE-3]